MLDRVLSFGDAWMPNYAPQRHRARRGACASRADRPIGLMVTGVPADPKVLESLETPVSSAPIHYVPSAGRGPVERALDAFETAVNEAHGG